MRVTVILYVLIVTPSSAVTVIFMAFFPTLRLSPPAICTVAFSFEVCAVTLTEDVYKRQGDMGFN